MKKVWQKLIAVCLMAGMLCSGNLVFTSAQAADESVSTQDGLVQAIKDAGKTPTTIKLDKSLTISATVSIPEGSDITLKAAGESSTIARGESFADEMLQVESDAKLTLAGTSEHAITISGKSTAKAAAVSVKKNGTLTAESCKFSDNKASSDSKKGGAVFGTGCSMSFNGCTFSGNQSTLGGAVCYEGSNGTIENCTFTKNSATGEDNGCGGAVALTSGSSVKITSGTWEDNTAAARGGAVYTTGDSTKLQMSSVLFEGNKASEQGGAIYHSAQGTGQYNARAGMTFSGNTATTKGDDISIDAAASGAENGGEYIAERNFAGDSLEWQKDAAGARQSGPADLSEYQNTNDAINLHSAMSDTTYQSSKSQAKVKFVGNTAVYGGALANSASVTIGSKGTSVSVEAVWAGDSNADQPDSIQAQLYQDGEASGDAITLNADGNWKHTWSDLDPDAEYTVKSTTELPSGYATEVTGSAQDGFVITNTYTAPVTPPEEPETGSLTISKQVTGDTAPASDTFQFTVVFSDNGTYGGIASGSTIELKAGGSRAIAGIPVGTTWTVTEAKKTNYAAEQSEKSEEMTAAGATAAFVNKYTAPATPVETTSISVKKVWAGDTNANQPKHVTVRLYQNGERYGDAVRLKAGNSWKHTWKNLDKSATYEVKETSKLASGYTKSISGSAAKGFVVTNTYKKPTVTTSSLTVSKTIQGTGADKTKQFQFKVTLGNKTISGTYGGMTFKNGEASFTLKGGESKKAEKLPVGTKYTVSETKYDNWTLKATNASGTITEKGVTAQFVNTYSKSTSSPNTGDSTNFVPWIILLLACAGGIVFLVVRQRKK